MWAVPVFKDTLMLECIGNSPMQRTSKFNDSFSLQSKCKVFYGQEPRSGESTTTECGFSCQLLAVIY